MKRSLSIAISILLSVLVLSACGQSTQEQWQEQYDLGVRYLTEGNYERAIIAFTSAIEIDPKQPKSYIGLANLYMELGNYTDANSVVEQGIESCGKLEELIFLQNEIFRDSQEEYSIKMPITYSVMCQEGDVIDIESISYEVEKVNNKYKNYCQSKTEDVLKTIYGTLNINGITWSGGERIYTCYPADSTQDMDVLIAAPLHFSETYEFKQLELKSEQSFTEYFSNGRLGSGSHICGLGRLEDGSYQYTIQEMLTTSNYMTIALYDESGVRTGLMVIELQPSKEVLEMVEKHTIRERIGN